MPPGLAEILATDSDFSATARMQAYVSMRKIADGEPHLAAFNVSAYSQATKHIWVVDDEIDVTNEAEVMWATATRFHGGTRPLGMEREFPKAAGVPGDVKGRMSPDEYLRLLDDREIGSLTDG